MFFVIRTAFWLTVVVLMLPGDPQSGTDAPRVGLFEAVLAARATIADISGFCDRNPTVCVTGGVAIHVLAEKAGSGVRLIYEAVSGGSKASGGQGTLNRDDLVPEWRGPKEAGSA